MQKQRGNFLLQALLALTLVFGFMPFFANKLSSRDMQARFYSTVGQIETAYTASRIYVREKKDNLTTGELTFDGNPDLHLNFNKELEPYGLPLGFNPQTVFGQNISLDINRSDEGVVTAQLKINGGDLSKFELTQLVRMIGFDSTISDENVIIINVPVEELYSDIVLRREPEGNIGFLTQLDMGGHRIDNIGVLYADTGHANQISAFDLSLTGNEAQTSEITSIDAEYTLFKTDSGWSISDLWSDQAERMITLVLQNSELNINDNLTLANIRCLLTGCPNLHVVTVDDENPSEAYVESLAFFDSVNGQEVVGMLYGPHGEDTSWLVEGDILWKGLGYFVVDGSVTANKIKGLNFSIMEDSFSTYEQMSGITTDRLITDKLIVSRLLFSPIVNVNSANDVERVGNQLDVVIDFKGTTYLPDLIRSPDSVSGFSVARVVDNDDIKIILYPYSSAIGERGLGTCRDIINSIREDVNISISKYDEHSVLQNIICKYEFYKRIEHRLNWKLRQLCYGKTADPDYGEAQGRITECLRN